MSPAKTRFCLQIGLTSGVNRLLAPHTRLALEHERSWRRRSPGVHHVSPNDRAACIRSLRNYLWQLSASAHTPGPEARHDVRRPHDDRRGQMIRRVDDGTGAAPWLDRLERAGFVTVCSIPSTGEECWSVSPGAERRSPSSPSER